MAVSNCLNKAKNFRKLTSLAIVTVHISFYHMLELYSTTDYWVDPYKDYSVDLALLYTCNLTFTTYNQQFLIQETYMYRLTNDRYT